MYENLIDPQIQILERCQVAWDNMVNTPEDLTSYVPGLTKADITKSFPMIIAKLSNIKVQPSEEASPFLAQTLSQNFPSWTTPLEGWIATSPANSASINAHLNAMWSHLIMFDSVPSVPKLEDVQRLVGEIKRLEVEAIGHVKVITEKDIEFEVKRDAVLLQCDQIMAKATDSLAAAARRGLAVSFERQAAEYDGPREGWLFAFLMSLMSITLFSCLYILPQIEGKTGVDRLYYFLTDIPLTLPFIWLAWFSALRFSQLGRLKEDYKFKVATALALDGYREQAEGLSKELEEKLLDLAIVNFGENPLRLMTKDSAKDAHPLAGIFDKQTVLDLFKAGIKVKTEKMPD
jgi:hypothetical protein